MQGTILGSRYRVLEYIAKGGFGKTYLAEDTQLPGRDKCVVKQLYPSLDDSNFVKIARRLFKTEAETLNTLGSHDQIPRLLAYFEEEEKFYLVQQYIKGHTLSKELPAGKPWSEAKVIELLKDCLNILDFIHSENVIHRDVKPDNLIRRVADNKLVLVDFGTVKEVIAEQTQLVPGTVAVGTRGYMPTEQARGKPRTTSDIYALGIIGIQAITGISPLSFAEDDDGELVWQSEANISRQLAEILTKMTRYHFKNRYQSATEAIESLNSLDNHEVEVVDPITEAVRYTPTVQLSPSQLANMAKANNAISSVVADDRSFLATPSNFVAESHSAPSDLNSQQLPELQDQPINENESSNSMTNANNSAKYKTLAALGAALVLGAAATGGMHFYKQQNIKNTQANLEKQEIRFNELLEKKDFKTCHEEVLKMGAKATSKPDSTEKQTVTALPEDKQQYFEAKCGLEQAKEEANDLKFVEALAIAKTLPKNSEIDEEIQEQVEIWSEKVLQQATKLYQKEGKLNEALEIVKQIPEDIPIRQQVIDTKENWKTEFQENETNIASAQKALSEEKWLFAKQEATKVKSSTSFFWKEKAKAIISQANEALGLSEGEKEASASKKSILEEDSNVDENEDSKTVDNNPGTEEESNAVVNERKEVTEAVQEEKPIDSSAPKIPEYEGLPSTDIPEYDERTKTIIPRTNEPKVQPEANDSTETSTPEIPEYTEPPSTDIPEYTEPNTDNNSESF